MWYIVEKIIRSVEQIKVYNTSICIYRFNLKHNYDSFREAAIFDINTILVDVGYKVVVFEPLGKSFDNYLFRFTDDLNKFKKICSIIVANRMSNNILYVYEKVYTRDWF